MKKVILVLIIFISIWTVQANESNDLSKIKISNPFTKSITNIDTQMADKIFLLVDKFSSKMENYSDEYKLKIYEKIQKRALQINEEKGYTPGWQKHAILAYLYWRIEAIKHGELSELLPEEAENSFAPTEGIYDGSWKPTGYHWNVTVKWFVEIIDKKENYCEENCKVYKYVYFNVLETENEYLYDYLKSKWQNSGKEIWLWCINNSNVSDILYYYNYKQFAESRVQSPDDQIYPDSYFNKFELNKFDSERIISSTKENPAIINLHVDVGRDWPHPPSCFSSFSIIEK